jgi:hypothetical protein
MVFDLTAFDDEDGHLAMLHQKIIVENALTEAKLGSLCGSVIKKVPFEEGDLVKAHTAFMTNGATPVQIQEGVQGIIVRIHSDGEEARALIKFEGTDQSKWVRIGRLHFLTKEASPDYSNESVARITSSTGS